MELPSEIIFRQESKSQNSLKHNDKIDITFCLNGVQIRLVTSVGIFLVLVLIGIFVGLLYWALKRFL